MKEKLFQMGFVPFEIFLKKINLNIINNLTQSLFIRYDVLPKNFLNSNFKIENNLSLTDAIKYCIRKCIHKKINNIIRYGYILNSKLVSLSPNQITYELNTEEFNELKFLLGDDLFIYILINCSLIQYQYNNYFLLCGNMPINKDNKCIKRHKLFYKSMTLIFDSIPRKNYSFFVKDKIMEAEKKYEKINLDKLFATYFDIKNKGFKNISKKYKDINEKNINCDKISQIDCKKLINFLFCVSKKIFKSIFIRYNFRILKQKLTLFIFKNKYETFSEEELIRHFKKSNKNFVLLVKYLFEYFYIPVMNKYFYCTESCDSKNKVCYYIRFDWYKWSDTIIKQHLKSDMFTSYHKSEIKPKLKKQEVLIKNEFENQNNDNNLKKNHNLNRVKKIIAQNIRVIPKNNTGRIITNLKIKNNENLLNSDVCLEYQILKYKYRSYLNNSMLGYEDIYKKIFPYINKQNIYILKMDIKKCFDNLDHLFLKKIIKGISFDEYIVKQFTDYTNTPLTKYMISDSYKSLNKWYENLKNKIIKDNFTKKIKKDIFSSKIIKSLLHNVISYKNKLYKQIKGIPQGSIFSTFICSLYFKHVDDEYFNIFNEGIMLRYVDDFLILSTDIQEINNFVDVSKQLQNLGIEFNENKFEKNFDNNFKLKNSVIKFCGLKIITKSYNYNKFNNDNFINMQKMNEQNLPNNELEIANIYYKSFIKKDLRDYKLSFSISNSSTNIGISIHKKIMRTFNSGLILLINIQNPKVYENIFDILLLFSWKLKILFKRAIFVNKKFRDRLVELGLNELFMLCKKRNIKISKEKIFEFYDTIRKNEKLNENKK